jgi:hypothetical protein
LTTCIFGQVAAAVVVVVVVRVPNLWAFASPIILFFATAALTE